MHSLRLAIFFATDNAIKKCQQPYCHEDFRTRRDFRYGEIPVTVSLNPGFTLSVAVFAKVIA